MKGHAKTILECSLLPCSKNAFPESRYCYLTTETSSLHIAWMSRFSESVWQKEKKRGIVEKKKNSDIRF